MDKTGKLLIFSSPSGCGKSTLINYLLQQNLNLHFSISATSRLPRGAEQNGKEYFFFSPEEFKQKIAAGAFLEYEEVYPNKFYGTLKEQVEEQLQRGETVVFDIDVLGGCNVKKYYGERALSIFIQPPSIEALQQRLLGRNTETAEVIEERLKRAEYELSFAEKYDKILVNDDLETAKKELLMMVKTFLGK